MNYKKFYKKLDEKIISILSENEKLLNNGKKQEYQNNSNIIKGITQAREIFNRIVEVKK